MKILILGSGVIGVSTAYLLAERGHEVTVLERNGESARETSFANGGQLSYSHAEPWATPAVLPKIAKWLGKKDAPLVFDLKRVDVKMWLWGIKFLANCTKEKAAYNTKNTWRLASYSKDVMSGLIEKSGVEFNYMKTGILHIFKDEHSMESQIEQARFQKELGCDFKILSYNECIRKEPVLVNTEKKIVGGLYFPIDESGDIYLFTKNLAEKAEKLTNPVKFRYNTQIKNIVRDGNKIVRVVTDKGDFTADKYIVSLGSYSPLYLKPIGINLPIYPMKGYSISIPINGSKGAPRMSITDQEHKLVYSRLGDILRVAGTAEFALYNNAIDEFRIECIRKSAKDLFPQAGDFEKISKWSCLRPQTPQGTPYIGKTQYENLILNTGHGTLGWTLAAGSAKIATDITEGKEPDIDLTGLSYIN